MSGWRVWLAWGLWLALLALWTYGLLSMKASRAAEYVPEDLRFYAAKGLHLTAYALLTFGAAWLPAPGRWAAWLGLLAHAWLTEWLQTFVPGRSGSVRDVLIDCAGVALGLLAAFCVKGVPGREEQGQGGRAP